MAKEPEKQAAEAAAEEPKKKLPLMLVSIVVGVMLLEGLGIVVVMKSTQNTKPVLAEVPAATQKDESQKDVEVAIIDAKLPNNKSGKLFLYDLQIVAKISEKNRVKVEDLLKERQAEIKDRIRTIIASASPELLSEPGLESLRRHVSSQLEQDLGPDLIKELLVPKCTPFRAEF